MLDFSFFYKITEYANEHWKCKMSKEEMHENALQLFYDFTISRKNKKANHEIKCLMNNLKEDISNGGKEALSLFEKIDLEFGGMENE